jgi:hypothetical protein
MDPTLEVLREMAVSMHLGNGGLRKRLKDAVNGVKDGREVNHHEAQSNQNDFIQFANLVLVELCCPTCGKCFSRKDARGRHQNNQRVHQG